MFNIIFFFYCSVCGLMMHCRKLNDHRHTFMLSDHYYYFNETTSTLKMTWKVRQSTLRECYLFYFATNTTKKQSLMPVHIRWDFGMQLFFRHNTGSAHLCLLHTREIGSELLWNIAVLTSGTLMKLVSNILIIKFLSISIYSTLQS